MRVKFDHFGGTINYFIDGDSSHKTAKIGFILNFTWLEMRILLLHRTKIILFQEAGFRVWGRFQTTVPECMIKGCNKTNINFCTKCIELNNWKIPDGYPW